MIYICIYIFCVNNVLQFFKFMFSLKYFSVEFFPIINTYILNLQKQIQNLFFFSTLLEINMNYYKL